MRVPPKSPRLCSLPPSRPGSCRDPAKFAGRRRAGPQHLLSPQPGAAASFPPPRSPPRALPGSPGRRPLPLALPRAGPRRAPGSAAKAHRGCAGPLSHAPGAAPGLTGGLPVHGLPGLPDPFLPAGLGRRVARAGASGGGCPARGPRSWTPRPRDPRRRRRRGGREAAGGDARGVAAERVPRSVHLRAPRPSGKYRGRLLRPRSRPAAYRPPAAAMTPRPRASATVSAARRRRGRRRLRLPSDVTAWAHSPLPGARRRRRRRARPASPPTRERGAGPGGAGPAGKGRGRAAARAPPGKPLCPSWGAAGGSGTHAALRRRAGLPEVGAPVTARQRAPCAPGPA